MTYAEKLKDPRWQKKRLRVLERDEWSCQICGDSESPLHVHHFIYEKGKDPWEAHDDMLTTLCESCHNYEHENEYLSIETINRAMKGAGLFSEDIIEIALGFSLMKRFHVHDVMASAISHALQTPEILRRITEEYFESLEKNRISKTGDEVSE